ncbi:hypothetical protein E2P64_07590 [Candidatus Bathyarchaeota archaeon]|nr:hypothetical protein E2P64_07590 [Candidatus Bathyarchaeota archaeon]
MTQKVTVDRGELYSALQKITQVIPQGKAARSDKYPEFTRYLHLRTDDGCLVIRGTDTADTLVVRIKAEGEIEACVLATTLFALVKPQGKLDGSTVEIESVEGEKVGGSVRIVSDSITTKVATGVALSEYPAVPGGRWKLLIQKWKAKDFKTILTYALLAAGRDETRPAINCVALIENRAVTTDGHRMHIADLPGTIKSDAGSDVKLSNKVALLCCKFLNDNDAVSIKQKKSGEIVVSGGNWELYSDVVPEKFPVYSQVVPKGCDFEVDVDRKKLATLLKKLSCLSNSVKVILNGNQCRLITESREFGNTETELLLDRISVVGAHIVIGFNIRYLLDAIDLEFDTVTLRFGNAFDPLLIRAGECRQAVVMPMRV